MHQEPLSKTPDQLKARLLEKVAGLDPKSQEILTELLSGRRQHLGRLLKHLMSSGEPVVDEQRAQLLMEVSKLMDTEGSGVFGLIQAMVNRPEKRSALVQHLGVLPRETDQSIAEEAGAEFMKDMSEQDRREFLEVLQSNETSRSLSGAELVALLRLRGNVPGNYFDLFPQVLPKLKRYCLLTIEDIIEKARQHNIPCRSRENYSDPDNREGPPSPRYLMTPDGTKIMIVTTEKGYIAIWYEKA